MTISERRTVVGVPVERVDVAEYAMMSVTAQDFYGEFGAHRRVGGILQVVTPDVIALRGESRFSQQHFYAKEAINRLKIEKRDGNKVPFVKQKVVWSRE